MRIDRREDHRLGADHPKISRAKRFRHDALSLPRAAIVARELSAIDDIGVERVRRHIAIFLSSDGMPFAESDLAIVATAGDAGRAALLLAAAQTIRKGVVGIDVIHLRCRLVVPTAPGRSAVDGYHRALIAA